jgi:hypothetical protein
MLDPITLARKGAHTLPAAANPSPPEALLPQGVIFGELARLASFSAPKNFFRWGTRAPPAEQPGDSVYVVPEDQNLR